MSSQVIAQQQDRRKMPGTGIDVFVVDFVFRPFAKIFEKMPGIVFLMLMLFYGLIAYIVIRSAYFSDQG